MIRLFDILISLILLTLFSPIMLLFSVWIVLDSEGGILFKQVRIGMNNGQFKILKFRTMSIDSESKGLLTVGADDRITSAGRFLRRTKLDELPQLFNVLKGEMSLVGPRPEVPKYVEMYSDSQKQVLAIRPGITDEASLEFFDESEILSQSNDPVSTYINEIMPRKIELNLPYVQKQTLGKYFKTLVRTAYRIISS